MYRTVYMGHPSRVGIGYYESNQDTSPVSISIIYGRPRHIDIPVTGVLVLSKAYVDFFGSPVHRLTW